MSKIRVKILSIVTLILITISCFGCTTYSYINSKLYTVAHDKIEVSNIKDLNIDWISGNVFVITTTDNTSISFYEDVDMNLEDKYLLHYYIDNDTLNISFSKKNISLSYKYQKKDLYVLIPVNYELDEIDVSLVSSNLTIDNIISNEFDVDIVNGFIEVEKINTNEASISSVSGYVNINDSEIDYLDADSISGNIITKSLKTKETNIDTTSGMIRLDIENVPNEIDIESISGSVEIALIDSIGYTASISSISGNFNSEFSCTENNKYICGNGKTSIDVDTTSGSISIKKR